MPSPLPDSARPDTLPDVNKSYTKGRTLPRRRTEISPGEPGIPERFALRLRELMDAKGWSSKSVAELVTKAGLPIGARGVDSWLRGDSLPKLKDVEIVGEALGFRDYRDLLPEPRKRRK